MRQVIICAILVVVMGVAGCTSRIHSTPPASRPGMPIKYDPKTRPYTVMGKTYYPLKSARGYDEVGMASWYGKDFHGRKTANGQVYNMYGVSAAHKTLPLGTRVRVTNLGNDRSVVLTINDRGPFVHGRVIDLSYGAARKLGTVEAGVAKVRITAVGTVAQPARSLATSTVKRFHVRVGAFADRANAERVHRQLVAKGYENANIAAVSRGGRVLHVVQAGSYSSRDVAEQVLGKLKEAFPTGYIIN